MIFPFPRLLQATPFGPSGQPVLASIVRGNQRERPWHKSNIYAGVAGYVGRADQVGTVGVFTRAAEPVGGNI